MRLGEDAKMRFRLAYGGPIVPEPEVVLWVREAGVSGRVADVQ